MTCAALLIHGAGAGAWEWNIWREVLAARRIQTLAPDLMPAASGLAETRFADYCGQVHAALRALPRPRAAVGASLGGLLAMAIADEADALVLINPMPPAPFHRRMPHREHPPTVAWRRNARLAGTRRALSGADDATALYAFRHWRDESGLVLCQAGAGIDIARPRCPVLCVISEDDQDVPAATTSVLAEAWRAETLRLPSAGHVAPLMGRDAAEVASRCADWLSAR